MTDNNSLLPMTFIGGGNMAQALITGWLKQGFAPSEIRVIEPQADTRALLQDKLGVVTYETAWPTCSDSQLVVWAVKPQVFKDVALPLAGLFPQALHLSVAAGVRSDSIARWLNTERVVRAMPNTPALVGLGQTGLFARLSVTQTERDQVSRLIQAVGQCIWVDTENLLDAVTALSGSGPAYVFYFMEAMVKAGIAMGLSPEQSHQLTIGTFVGACELASSSEPPEMLRERVTSKGGTTYAAITRMQSDGLSALIAGALQSAHKRSEELGSQLDPG